MSKIDLPYLRIYSQIITKTNIKLFFETEGCRVLKEGSAPARGGVLWVGTLSKISLSW